MNITPYNVQGIVLASLMTATFILLLLIPRASIVLIPAPLASCRWSHTRIAILLELSYGIQQKVVPVLTLTGGFEKAIY